MRCAADCHQGRRKCPTPQACLRPEFDDGPEMLGAVLIYAVACCAVLLLAFVVIV